MTKFGFIAFILCLLSAPAMAETLYIAGPMQSCSAHEDCTLVATQCGQACATTPANQQAKVQLEASYTALCGQPATENSVCTSQDSFKAVCMNNRCTISQAYQYNASVGDYASPTPERPVANSVSRSYSYVDDTDGSFTAYDLPSDEVHNNIMGQYKDIIQIEPAAGN